MLAFPLAWEAADQHEWRWNGEGWACARICPQEHVEPFERQKAPDVEQHWTPREGLDLLQRVGYRAGSRSRRPPARLLDKLAPPESQSICRVMRLGVEACGIESV